MLKIKVLAMVMAGLRLIETYTKLEVVERLASLNTKAPGYDTSLIDHLPTVADQTRYKTLLRTQTGGTASILYEKSSYGVGRLYAKGTAFTYQSLPKVVRRLLLSGTGTMSLDIVNCQPTLLMGLVAKWGYSGRVTAVTQAYPSVMRYVKERQACLDDAAASYGVSREKVKGLFIRMTFGGCPLAWAVENGLTSAPTHFVTRFHTEKPASKYKRSCRYE